MYHIRTCLDRPLLEIELSGHVTTDESVRLLTLATELVRSDHLRAVRCDMTSLDYGPERPATVAAVLAALLPTGVRIAVTGTPGTLRGVSRVVRLAHAGDTIRLFESASDADAWLSLAAGVRGTVPATAQRHVDELFTAATERTAQPAPRRVSAA
jgi:hypothetical protein